MIRTIPKFIFHFRFSKIKQQIGTNNKIHLIHQLHIPFLLSMPPTSLLLIIFTFLPILILASTQSVQLLSSSADSLSLVSGLTARFQCSVYRCGPSETKPPSVLPKFHISIFNPIFCQSFVGTKMTFSFSMAPNSNLNPVWNHPESFCNDPLILRILCNRMEQVRALARSTN